MLNVRLAGDHLYGKLLFPRLSLVVSKPNLTVTWTVGDYHPFRVALGGSNGGVLLLRIFSVTISVSPHVCFISDLILNSMFLR